MGGITRRDQNVKGWKPRWLSSAESPELSLQVLGTLENQVLSFFAGYVTVSTGQIQGMPFQSPHALAHPNKHLAMQIAPLISTGPCNEQDATPQ